VVLVPGRLQLNRKHGLVAPRLPGTREQNNDRGHAPDVGSHGLSCNDRVEDFALAADLLGWVIQR